MTGRSLADMSSVRQSEQQGITDIAAKNSEDVDEKTKTLLAEFEEQKVVINDLIDQITQKTIEIADLKSQVDRAFKEVAEAKTELAQCKFEKVNLEEVLEQMKKKIYFSQRRDLKKTSSSMS